MRRWEGFEVGIGNAEVGIKSMGQRIENKEIGIRESGS
jgi:hypothetical protein